MPDRPNSAQHSVPADLSKRLERLERFTPKVNRNSGLAEMVEVGIPDGRYVLLADVRRQIQPPGEGDGGQVGGRLTEAQREVVCAARHWLRVEHGHKRPNHPADEDAARLYDALIALSQPQAGEEGPRCGGSGEFPALDDTLAAENGTEPCPGCPECQDGEVVVSLSREEAGTIRDVLDRYSPGREMDLDLPAREKQLEAINKLRAALKPESNEEQGK